MAIPESPILSFLKKLQEQQIFPEFENSMNQAGVDIENAFLSFLESRKERQKGKDARMQRAIEKGFPEALGQAARQGVEGVLSPISELASGGASFLGRIASGASDDFSDNKIEEIDSQAVIETEAQQAKQKVSESAALGVKKAEDLIAASRQLDPYITEQALSKSPFFGLKGDTPFLPSSSKKGFSRSSKSIGEQSIEDSSAKIQALINKGDYVSAGALAQQLPKSKREETIALIAESIKRPKEQGVAPELVKSKVVGDILGQSPALLQNADLKKQFEALLIEALNSR